jgi:predicted neuraminidase
MDFAPSSSSALLRPSIMTRSISSHAQCGSWLIVLYASFAAFPPRQCAAADVPGTAGVLDAEFIFEKAPYPSCHAATIVETKEGKLVAAWFGGTAERNPDVGIWVSRHENGKWLEAVEVANGIQEMGPRLPTWNPVLFQAPGGDLHLYYKIGPSPAEWWGMELTSPDGGVTWTKPTHLPDGILGPIKNKPIVLADGTWLAPSSNEADGWTAHVERSTDAGKTWKLIGPLNDGHNFRAIQPTLIQHKDGRIQLLARGRQDKIVESWSDDGGLTWSPLVNGELPNNNSGLDAVTLKDGRFLLVYNHSTLASPGMGHKGRGILNVAVSPDGKAWEAALALDYLAQPEKQFSYPSVIQTSDGKVHIVYTWHRERIKHVVLDPAELETVPIEHGVWPKEVTGGFEIKWDE